MKHEIVAIANIYNLIYWYFIREVKMTCLICKQKIKEREECIPCHNKKGKEKRYVHKKCFDKKTEKSLASIDVLLKKVTM